MLPCYCCCLLLFRLPLLLFLPLWFLLLLHEHFFRHFLAISQTIIFWLCEWFIAFFSFNLHYNSESMLLQVVILWNYKTIFFRRLSLSLSQLGGQQLSSHISVLSDDYHHILLVWNCSYFFYMKMRQCVWCLRLQVVQCTQCMWEFIFFSLCWNATFN